tara:strand:- start:87 stop:476 length:390 start_codon:yes stop_codon:yes gene_type:complete
MASVSADIAKPVDITIRRNDSFYLKVVVTNDDGTVYDLLKDDNSTPFDCQLIVYSSDNNPILGFSNTDESATYFVDSSITVTPSTAAIVIDAAASYITIKKGSYKYKLVVTGTTEVNTLMIGKIKVIDI